MCWTCPCTRVQYMREDMENCHEACPYLWSLPPPHIHNTPTPPTNKQPTQIEQNLKELRISTNPSSYHTKLQLVNSPDTALDNLKKMEWTKKWNHKPRCYWIPKSGICCKREAWIAPESMGQYKPNCSRGKGMVVL
jgi:hypothetical protein